MVRRPASLSNNEGVDLFRHWLAPSGRKFYKPKVSWRVIAVDILDVVILALIIRLGWFILDVTTPVVAESFGLVVPTSNWKAEFYLVLDQVYDGYLFGTVVVCIMMYATSCGCMPWRQNPWGRRYNLSRCLSPKIRGMAIDGSKAAISILLTTFICGVLFTVPLLFEYSARSLYSPLGEWLQAGQGIGPVTMRSMRYAIAAAWGLVTMLMIGNYYTEVPPRRQGLSLRLSRRSLPRSPRRTHSPTCLTSST